MTGLPWLWIPITIGAALAQTLRNAAQRHLTTDLGALGATLVRFLYGLPFALAWLAAVMWAVWNAVDGALPGIGVLFLVWTVFGSLAQIAATALLLHNMEERNFALGVAYSKTELVQVAVFGIVLLGDPLTLAAAAAIALATAGVMVLSLPVAGRSLGTVLGGLSSRSALLGLGSGAAFAIAAVGYRGAALALDTPSLFLAAAYSLVWAQAVQTAPLGGYLLWRHPGTVIAVIRAWRVSLVAGGMGATASACWFTAMALEPVANVRTLGLIELFFSYIASRRLFRDRFSGAEIAGFALLALGLIGIVAPR
jgi:drug/metabolite transporter (DMT)-like permease